MPSGSRHLQRIGATGRPSGGRGAADARAYCAGVLRDAGFMVREHEFEYSAFPGAWAMPIAGLVTAVVATLFYLGRWVPPLLGIAVTVLLLTLASLALLGRQGVLTVPFMRRRGVNLEAMRPETPPHVWLVAHLDSKWQPVSMFARVAGVVGTAIGLLFLLGFALAGARGSQTVASVVLVATWAAAVPLVLSVVGDRNQGTLDNASGVATVLEAAESIPAAARVGILITDAEELALAGARAWMRGRAGPPAVALNCDSVDDEGPLVLMYTRRRPDALIGRIEAAARARSEPIRARRLLPGILTDGVVFAEAGWEAVTLSRGTLRTLGRIHTSRDTLDAMRGSGLAGAAAVLAPVATELG